MNIYDRIKLLPEELENLIYKYVFYMNIGGVNKAFNKFEPIKPATPVNSHFLGFFNNTF